ncbi:MAG TPA: glycosyltransferase family 1 protein [Thermomicrobiaceae bacterium]|nr:glycosyltransferase family 1 protein [Thermomicrobiaceae bacterium]
MNTAPHRIAFDGLFLQQPTTGSGQYALHLWPALVSDDTSPQVVLVQPAGAAGGVPASGATSVFPPPWARSGKPHKLWWEQRGVVRAARTASADLLHVPYFAGPRVGRLPLVMTIHDVIPMVMPDYGGSAAMRLYLRLVSAVARRASAVITDSDCSARDIQGWLAIPPARLHVIPLAAAPTFRPIDDPETAAALRERYSLPGPVIFNVDGLDVRKNLPALVEAFARALPDLPEETRLVIAGRPHTGNARLYPPLEPAIRARGLQEHVVLTGRLSDAEKLGLYNLADLYVSASLYEGFGLSPLEAMACGTPVISSNRSSLPEVVGSGGLLVDPTPPRLAAAIVSVMSDERMRRDLSRRGLARAASFSWRRTADLTRNVYRRVLGEPALAGPGRQPTP